MRFVLVGNGLPAREAIKAIRGQAGSELVGFFTGDGPAMPTPRLAQTCGVPTWPEQHLLRAAAASDLAALGADWLISADSRTILSPAVLDAVKGQALNLHPGRLPDYAGLHTHQWAIRNGEDRFGVTIHMIEPGIDTGDIVAEAVLPIKPDDTGLSLFQRCIREGARLLAQVLENICQGRPLCRRAQDLGRRKLYRHRDALSGQIDWTWGAARIRDFIRAGNYHPLASPTYTATLPEANGMTIRLLGCEIVHRARSGDEPGKVVALDSVPEVACGEGFVRLVEAIHGGGRMTPELWRSYLGSVEPPYSLAGGVRPA